MFTDNIHTSCSTLVFYGYKIKPTDIRSCLQKLTDLSGALHGFSVRVLKNEIPRRKMIIDVELSQGFDPCKYNSDSYLHEFLSKLKKVHRSLADFIKYIPAECFPELHFHAYSSIQYDTGIYKSRCYCLI